MEIETLLKNPVYISQAEYDKWLEMFEEKEPLDIFPTPTEIDTFFEAKPSKNVLRYLCFLEDTNRKPETAEERYSMKNMRSIIKRYLITEKEGA